MRKAFVHVGMPKTGTTAIQKALSKARNPLRCAGLLYPGDAVDHAFLISKFHPAGSQHFYFQNQGISSKAADRVFQTKFDRLKREIAENDGDVLLSTEYLFNMRGKNLRELMMSLSEIGLDLHLVCYVRHPISQATSGIQQNVKMGHGDLTEMLNYPIWHSFVTPLKPAIKILGSDRVIVQSFDSAKNIGAERHILKSIGHANTMDLVERVETNVSLSGAAVVLANAHNRLLKKNPGFPSTKSYLFKIGGPRFSLPLDTIYKIRDRAQTELDWLEKHFSLKLPEPESRSFEYQSLSVEAAEDIVRFIVGP